MTLSQAGEITPCNRHHAISLLFANDPQLFHFFFTEDRLTLRWDDAHATARLADSELGIEESILVHLALDFWLERGEVRLHETYRHLGPDRFLSLIMALELMHTSGGCGCSNCRQRFRLMSSAWSQISQ